MAGAQSFFTAMWLEGHKIKGIDGFWDWVVYNLFWIVLPIKSTIKFFKNI